MEPGFRVMGHRVSDFGLFGSGHSRVSVSDPVFDPLLCFNMRVYRYVTPSRQTNIRGFSFDSVPVTALLIYLFQLVPVIFTYLCADCPCDVTTRSGRVGSPGQKLSGRVESQVKNPDPVSSLMDTRHCPAPKLCSVYACVFCCRSLYV